MAKVKRSPLTQIQNRALFPNPKFLQSQNNRKKLLNLSGVDFDHMPRSLTQKTFFTRFKKSAEILLRDQDRTNSIISSKTVRFKSFFHRMEIYTIVDNISQNQQNRLTNKKMAFARSGGIFH